MLTDGSLCTTYYPQPLPGEVWKGQLRPSSEPSPSSSGNKDAPGPVP